MKKKKKTILLALAVAIVAGGAAVFFILRGNGSTETIKKIKPEWGDILLFISTTGVVEPQNRLEIKPPIDGRVEQILVREGDRVKAGQVLAWMSSTERAALLDAARDAGAEVLRYWQEAYKASPLIAPIDGEVIVRAVEPGQTISSSTAVLVLSDRLIVKAQVDETDIGRVKLGQPATVTLDAYPEVKVTSRVDHIAYESKTVNNVTIYEVDVLPDKVPEVFRSGMSADVKIIEDERENVLTLPLEAVSRRREAAFVLVEKAGADKPERRKVELGLADDQNVEIADGLGEDDVVLIVSRSQEPSKSSPRQGSNPFMPSGPRGGGRGSGGGGGRR